MVEEWHTTPSGLQWGRDWDREGGVRMKNAKTSKLYYELRYGPQSQPNEKDYGCFSVWAFTKPDFRKKFDEGYARLVSEGWIKDGDKVAFCEPLNLYGTDAEIRRYIDFYHKRDERIKNECDPQEAYFVEYNNYECMISHDDTDVYSLMVSLFGEEAASKIKRLC